MDKQNDFTEARATAFTTTAGLTLLAVMALGVWQVVGAVRAGLEFPSGPGDFREGRTTQTIEKQIDQKLPVRATLIAAANSLRYRLMRGAGDQVRLGADDWLYLTDELRFYPDADAHQAARITLLAAASKALAERGVRLVVALVPDKARVHPGHLPEGQAPAYTGQRYAQALASLRAQGVFAIDLLAPLQDGERAGAMYYRTDTHWNQAGARVAAQAVADGVKGLGLALDPTSFAQDAAGAETERPGDLIRLMGLSDVPNFWRPKPDREAAVTTRQTSADSAGGGLLGDAAAVPVVLTGTSYSLRGNFHGYLQEALSAKVLNTAKDGGGFLQAATDYFKDEAFKASPPKLVVWELPERFLPAPLESKEAGWLREVGLAP